MALKFVWNGIKGSDGKLQSASYSDGRLWVRFPDEMNDGRFEHVACGELRPSGDRVPGSPALIAAAGAVVRANRSYLETNPYAALHPDALTVAIARLEEVINQ